MRKLEAFCAAVLLAGTIGGCGKGAKCDKAFTNVENFVLQMAKGMGQDEASAKKDFESKKDQFIDQCKKSATDEQLNCLTQEDLAKAMSDPKCQDALKRMKMD